MLQQLRECTKVSCYISLISFILISYEATINKTYSIVTKGGLKFSYHGAFLLHICIKISLPCGILCKVFNVFADIFSQDLKIHIKMRNIKKFLKIVDCKKIIET